MSFTFRYNFNYLSYYFLKEYIKGPDCQVFRWLKISQFQLNFCKARITLRFDLCATITLSFLSFPFSLPLIGTRHQIESIKQDSSCTTLGLTS